AQRQHAEDEFRLVLAEGLAPDHAAEADREAQHLDLAGHGDAVVAELVDRDQDPDRDEEPECFLHHARPDVCATRARAASRARASSASRPEMARASSADGSTRASVSALMRWIASKRSRPSRKDSTATSLAAFSTAVEPGAARSASHDRNRPGKRRRS